MLHRFSRKASLFKIKPTKMVYRDGRRLNTEEPNPMIVIGFENNRDGYSKHGIESQDRFDLSSWIYYFFTRVQGSRALSMGGLVFYLVLLRVAFRKEKADRKQTRYYW